jgi:hypothetical protein
MQAFFRISVISVLCLLVGLLAACSEDDPAAPAPEPANLTEFFNGVPAWDSYSPPLADSDEATGPGSTEEETIDGVVYNCTTTPYSLTRTPEKIVTLNPDVEVLWVGSLLQGQGYVGGIGSLVELPIRQRTPMALTIDLLTGNNTRTIDRPTLATSNQAIGQLIDDATAAGHTAGSNILFTKETMFSYDQMALKMGLSASYSGATIKASLSTDISNETRTVAAYFVQRMFTVSMVLPQSPEAVFSDEFTKEMLDQERSRGRMGPGNPPVFVSSIAFGRILIFSFTSTASETDINATLNVMYNGGEFGGEMEAKYQEILQTAQIRVVTVGGDANQALALIRSNDLGQYFAEDAPLSTAKPISYTIRHLKDNVIARVAEATDYNLTSCTPKELPVTGAEYEITMTRICPVDLAWLSLNGGEAIADGLFNIEAYYQFWIEDESGAQKAIEWMSQAEYDYVASLSVGQCHTLVDRGGRTAQPIRVKIHFDGRDNVRIHGTVWDADWLAGDDAVFNFSRTFVNNLTEGEGKQLRADAFGNEMDLFWRVQKVGDLTD